MPCISICKECRQGQKIVCTMVYGGASKVDFTILRLFELSAKERDSRGQSTLIRSPPKLQVLLFGRHLNTSSVSPP